MTRVVIKFDGACDNNSKLSIIGVGVAVWINGNRRSKYEVDDFGGLYGTNNVAEWLAFKAALKSAKEVLSDYPEATFRIYGDSQLIIKQFSGEWRVKQPHLKPYKQACQDLYIPLAMAVKLIAWVPRKENTDADLLSKEGVRKYLRETNMI